MLGQPSVLGYRVLDGKHDTQSRQHAGCEEAVRKPTLSAVVDAAGV